MSAAQIHLALNHFPVAGFILAFVIVVWGIYSKSTQIKQVAVLLIIISAFSAIIVSTSGEGAEEIVEHKPMVTKELIHAHEEASETAMIFLQATAVLAIAWVVTHRMKKPIENKIFLAVALANLISIGLIADTAHKGGQIRHDELRMK